VNTRSNTLSLAIALVLATPTVMAATEADSSAASAKELDAVSVIGEGETRQVQTLQAIDLKRAVPGTSPLKVMDKLPGVNFTSSDPFGAYEWSTRITVRGFNQNQLGFTLDGIPLGDMSYGNHNGLHISRAAMAENIDYVELAQGAGAASTASTSNLGGTAQFFTRDPSMEYGSVDGIRRPRLADAGQRQRAAHFPQPRQRRSQRLFNLS